MDHLGIQVDEADELTEIAQRLNEAGERVVPQEKAECCYALSDKAWSREPDGVTWETFHTLGAIEVFGDDGVPQITAEGACCGDGAPTP